MDMNDMEMLSKIIWKRKEQRLDRKVCNLEQERYRFFLWLMEKMDDEVERAYPPVGRMARRFICKKSDERRIIISTTGVNNTFVPIPTVLADEFIPVIIETVEYIEKLEGYEILNRFPKDSKTKIEEFLIVIGY